MNRWVGAAHAHASLLSAFVRQEYQNKQLLHASNGITDEDLSKPLAFDWDASFIVPKYCEAQWCGRDMVAALT